MKEFKNIRWDKKTVVLLLVIFIGVSVFFALRLKRSIIPDETHHFPVSQLYSTVWGIPPDTSETYRFSYLSHKSFLYYWINGRVLNILRLFFPTMGEWRELVSLRLLSVLYSLGTVLFTYKLAKEFIANKWGQVFVVFLLTNTLMFVFISSGVNYDSLANLCSVVGIYFLTRVFRGGNFYQNSFGWLFWIFLGTLVKITILPLATIMFLSWFFFIIRKHREINFRIYSIRQFSLMLFVLGLLFIGNFSVYGINLVKYESLNPACDQVLTEEQCMSNRIFARSQKFTDSLTLNDIVEGTGSDPIAYFFDYWIAAMFKMIFGVLGHRSFSPATWVITVYRLIFMICFLAMVRYWRKPSYALGNLYIVVIFYSLVLFFTNYRTEMRTGFLHIAIQGRYIFPVIGAIYILTISSLLNISNLRMRQVSFSLLLILFLWNGPLVFPLKPYVGLIPEHEIPKEQPIGEITGGVTISQGFISECEGAITQIDLRLATYARINTHPITIRLVDTVDNQMLVEHIIAGESIQDNAWHSFVVPPVTDSLGKTYEITIVSPESTSGNAITIWSGRDNFFSEGHAKVNGEFVNKDLNFRYQCERSIYAAWFY